MQSENAECEKEIQHRVSNNYVCSGMDETIPKSRMIRYSQKREASEGGLIAAVVDWVGGGKKTAGILRYSPYFRRKSSQEMIMRGCIDHWLDLSSNKSQEIN